MERSHKERDRICSVGLSGLGGDLVFALWIGLGLWCSEPVLRVGWAQSRPQKGLANRICITPNVPIYI